MYVFDAADFGRTPFGFEKTGRERARFLLDAVAELRAALRARGSDLVVRIGRPATVVASLARAVGASVVYTHQHLALSSTSTSSSNSNRRRGSSMSDNGDGDNDQTEDVFDANATQLYNNNNNNNSVMMHTDQQMQDEYDEEEEEDEDEQELFKQFDIDLRQLWANTLYDVDDLPFSSLLDLPEVYVTFRQAVQARSSVIRPPLSAPDSLPGMPVHVRVLPGEIPTLFTLGFKPCHDSTTVSSNTGGGELEGLRRIADYCVMQNQQQNRNRHGSMTSVQLGADFTCHIAAWLSLGCVSPRKVYDDIAKCKQAKFALGETYFELLWRDFFRFVTAKYAVNRRKAASVARARRRTVMGKRKGMGVASSSIAARRTGGGGLKHGGNQQHSYHHLGTAGGGVTHAQRRWNSHSSTTTASAAANAEIRKRAKAAAASVSANAPATATAIATKAVTAAADDKDVDVGPENDVKAPATAPLFVARRRRFSRSLVGGGL